MTVAPSDVRYEYSGGTGNNEPGDSLGGDISGVAIQTGALNNLFDDVTETEALDGSIEYRCIYFVNNHASEEVDDVKTWLHTETPSTDSQFSLGLDPNGVQSTPIAKRVLEETATVFTGYQSEYSEKNHLLYSLDFSNAAWAKFACTVSTGVYGPSNSSQACGIIGTTASSVHDVYQTITLSTSYSHVLSCYCKAGARSWTYLECGVGYGYFDLDNEVVGTGLGTLEIEHSIADGYSRCSAYTLTTISATNYPLIYPAFSDGVKIYTGDGATVDLYVFGAQVEQRTQVPGSLVWNEATADNRAEDSLTYRADDGNLDLGDGSTTFEFHIPGAYTPETQMDILKIYKTGDADYIMFSIDTNGYYVVTIRKESGTPTVSTGSVNLADDCVHSVEIQWDALGGGGAPIYIDGVLMSTLGITDAVPDAFDFDYMEILTSYRAVSIRDWRCYDSAGVLLFSAIDGFSGVSNLPAPLTINGQTQTPHLRYKGEDATETAWPAWGYGDDMAVVGSGPAPNTAVKCLGTDERGTAVQALTVETTRQEYRNTTQYIGNATDDFFVTIIARVTQMVTASVYYMGDLTSVSGIVMYNSPSTPDLMSVLIKALSVPAYVSTTQTAPTYKYVVMTLFGNRDENSTDGCRLFSNDAASSGSNIYSLADISGDGDLEILQRTGQEQEILYVADYLKADWFAAGSTGSDQAQAAHNETLLRFTGVWPSYAAGTTTPSSWGTDANACTQSYDGITDTHIVHFLGQGLPRVGTVQTSGTVLKNVTFSRPLTEGTALDITSMLGSGEAQAIWVKRTITAAASSYDNDFATIRTQCTTD